MWQQSLAVGHTFQDYTELWPQRNKLHSSKCFFFKRAHKFSRGMQPFGFTPVQMGLTGCYKKCLHIAGHWCYDLCLATQPLYQEQPLLCSCVKNISCLNANTKQTINSVLPLLIARINIPSSYFRYPAFSITRTVMRKKLQ